MILKRFATGPLWIAVLFLLPGCGSGDEGPVTVPVSGVITLDKKPMEGLTVNFFSEEGDFLSSGVTDAEGRYQLYQGAVVGKNKVWINKFEAKPTPEGDPAEDPHLDPGQLEAMTEGALMEVPNETLPAKFSDPSTSVLSFNVPEDGSEKANFDITSE